MPLLVTLVQALVGLAFLALGVAKIAGLKAPREAFERLRLPGWLRYVTGAIEGVGGLAMLASIAQPFLAFFAAGLLATVALGALAAHLLRGPRVGWPAPAALLVGAVAVGFLQPLGLRVMALPKVDPLPFAPVARSEVLKTYAPGEAFEGVKVAPDGTLLLAVNTGVDLRTGDKSRVRARIIARDPNGRERTVFDLPPGATAGAMAFDAAGTLYMVGDGAKRGVWRFPRGGSGELFARLPEGAWPNGIDVGPDGAVYVSDSLLGLIWRVDAASGAVLKAAEHSLLRRRPFVALAPGANGLHFHGRDLFVAVSDLGKLLKMTLDAQGRLGAPTVVASGLPGDDFAIDAQGTIYLTTHPYNTVVRITPDGTRTVVADARQGVTGATAADFGRSQLDAGTLYVVTDGGAFSGDVHARGALVALHPPIKAR